MRIKPDGSVNVSAHPLVPLKVINRFLLSNIDFILKSKSAFKEKVQLDTAPKQLINGESFYRLGNHQLLKVIKSRSESVSNDGRYITLNSLLIEMPKNCIEYVLLHEYCHFIHPNHSKDFYAYVSMLMPDWKERKKLLKSSRKYNY